MSKLFSALLGLTFERDGLLASKRINEVKGLVQNLVGLYVRNAKQCLCVVIAQNGRLN